MHLLAKAYATGSMVQTSACTSATNWDISLRFLWHCSWRLNVCSDMTRCQLVDIYHRDWILPGIWQRWLTNIYQWRLRSPEKHHVKWLNGYKSTQHHIPVDISLQLNNIRYTVRSVHNMMVTAATKLIMNICSAIKFFRLLATMHCMAC